MTWNKQGEMVVFNSPSLRMAYAVYPTLNENKDTVGWTVQLEWRSVGNCRICWSHTDATFAKCEAAAKSHWAEVNDELLAVIRQGGQA